MDKKTDDVNRAIDRQEQYSRRNFILVYGIKESESEDTDDVTETLNEFFARKQKKVERHWN